MDMEIKRAGVEDAERLTEHRMQFMREMFGKDSTEQFRQATLGYLKKHLADGSCICQFIENNDTIICICFLCLYEYMPRHNNPTGRTGYFNNLYTAPAYRGRGIAERILRALIESAKRAGVNEVYLHSEMKSISLYKRVGFEMTTLDMMLQLE
ncbi:MAG: GNAT family N-acetyltransferase [Planctomycetes bacterium]|nr:GNAT family N-acetyltransferase [Planctomycetota bacterium]